jgi:hypothetical protein
MERESVILGRCQPRLFWRMTGKQMGYFGVGEARGVGGFRGRASSLGYCKDLSIVD